MKKIFLMMFLFSIVLLGQSYQETSDATLKVAKGNIPGHSNVNKFGYAPSGLQTTATDIWDLADATPTQQIWVAPTTAQVHKIVSSNALDSSGTSGRGAKTIRIYGLTSWNTDETSEDVSLGGTDSVSTTNSYAIIHRMKVLTSGDSAINLGNIKAIAGTDLTVTAQISIGLGQTEMAIYGVPSTKAAYLVGWYGTVMKQAASAATAEFHLCVNENPTSRLNNFITKDIRGTQSTGSSSPYWISPIPKKFVGPCIIKIQAIGSAADIDGSAGFDLILADN